MTNHPNRSKQQQATHTPDTSTKRKWEELAHEAIYDAGEWKRQCRNLQVLNAELLAALKAARPFVQGTTLIFAQIDAAIAKAEGR